ncbi:MAG: heavy metal-associated domain-containing protein [Patescibacteria group bacterium]
MNTTLMIQGTHCRSCKILIEDVCREMAGVRVCHVDFNTGKTEVEHDESLDWKTFKQEIESLGTYHVEASSRTSPDE